jgi:hypothetical protein
MTDPHATDAPGHGPATGGDHHDVANHGDTDGRDDHAHGDEPLGPVDLAAWGAGVLGVGIAVVIAACFVLSTSGIG